MDEKRVDRAVKKLVTYGLEHGFFEACDATVMTNRILEALKKDSYTKPEETDSGVELEPVLGELLDYACETGVIEENSTVYRDLFDTKLMGLITPRPGEVIQKFYSLYEESPRRATDFYYEFSQATDYIRRYRIRKDQKWKTPTEYGELDITINLSKPEKDPKAIAAARNAAQSGYPKCLLCGENAGYAGRLNHPARQNHRVIPVRLGGREWGLQYSPYVYYNEHCIVFHPEHTPMKIDRDAFTRLFEFVKQFPHYFIGSNADLPIVGGSILTHDHLQGGRYTFAMEQAPVEQAVTVPGFTDVEAGIVKWPMSALRLRCGETERLVDLADHILRKWREYSDPAVRIFAYTNGEPHNTITPIARKSGDCYELDLVLRNNLTTEEYPLGIFHPHEELHHIKKENIGLIEVMGLAILPARLLKEMELLSEAVLEGRDIRSCPPIAKHAGWAEEFLPRYSHITAESLDDILKKEIGLVFKQVLEQAGVYKRDGAGRRAFERFLDVL